MRIGIEVEGRLKGIKTLYMRAPEALTFFDFPSLKKRVTSQRAIDEIESVRMIYISDHDNEMKADSPCLKIWANYGFLICIERTEILDAHYWPDYVSFLLVVDSDSFWGLRPTDQIKFTRNMHVKCLSVENMITTVPGDFEGDIEFEAYTKEVNPNLVR